VPLRAINVGKLDAEFAQDDVEQVRRVPDVPPRLTGENAKGRTIEAPDKRVGRDLGQIIGCESFGDPSLLPAPSRQYQRRYVPDMRAVVPDDDGRYRFVPAHPSKHGASTEPYRSRPLTREWTPMMP
jgi:hypothetical protein